MLEAMTESDDVVAIDDEILDQTVVAIFSLLCAACITFVSVCVLYFSALEFSLMRRYQSHGSLTKSDVITTNFARSRVSAKADCSQATNDVEQEYVVFLEYRRVEREYYTLLVRKQVKATEPDFIKGDIDEQIQMVEIPIDMICNGMSMPAYGRQMEVLVLPAYPKSGIPRRQGEKACTIHYRASTVVLICFMFAIADFLIHLAYYNLSNDYAAIPRSPWAVPLALLAMVVSAFVFVHFVLCGIFQSALSEEYLECGGKMEMTGGESTLSSRDGFRRDVEDDASFVVY